MPDLIIKPEDLEEMPEKTRELLLEYVLPKMGFHKMGRGWSTTKLKPYSTLSDKPATYIPIEAAIAVLAPLKEQGIRAASILVKDNKVASPGNFSKRGYSRAELAKQLGISEKSINGVIGSINRRFSFRFDKTKYDRKKCRVIRFDRKAGQFEFLNDQLKFTFACALEAIEEVRKEGLSYEQYDFTKIEFGKDREFVGAEDRKLSQDAIEEFLREDNESHKLSWMWVEETGDVSTVTHNVDERLLVGQNISHLLFESYNEYDSVLICLECHQTIKDGASRIEIGEGKLQNIIAGGGLNIGERMNY